MMRVSAFLTLIIFFCLFSSLTEASEVDSYTNIQLIQDGAVDEINKEINALIRKAVYTANVHGGQEPEDLYHIVNKTLGGRIVSRLEKILEQKNDGRVLKVDIRDSIYSDLGLLRAPSLILSRKMGGVFKADNYIIGTDKLGHFIAQGYQYFKKCYLQGNGIEDALLYGINSELTYYGLVTTGVYSYGDLVANFQGMRFWNDILGMYPDILKEDIRPYVQQENGRWVVISQVDMRRYFDAGWDERINQNLFSDTEVNNTVNNRIQSLKDKEISPPPETVKTLLGTLKGKYKAYSTYLLNIGNFPKAQIKKLKGQLKAAKKSSAKTHHYLSEKADDPILTMIDEYI